MNENVLTAYASKPMAETMKKSLKILWRDARF